MLVVEREEIDFLVKASLSELIHLANQTRKEYVGEKFEPCSIINAKSGLCSEDCKFCAQSLHYSTSLDIYPLKTDKEILKRAKFAKEIGAHRFGIVSSGRRLPLKEVLRISSLIEEIQENIGIKVCCSLGALDRESLEILKSAGLSRYHHNIETSRRFYPRIVSTHNFEERLKTINTAKELGFEVCSGGIIGLGESWQDRIEMAYLLRDLEVNSIPLNILVPIKGTPLEGRPLLPCWEAIKTICIFRIILKDKIIKVAAGRETVLKDFQALAFLAGANGMLIGGYLTIPGRDIEEDYQLIKEVERMWRS